MICSTIIPTIGRASLTRAVLSVLEQDFNPSLFEVIVVNDSGKPLPAEAWMGSPQVKILHTNRHNRSVARNTGAAAGRGKYLHFLDDDDWMLPGAFQCLAERAASEPQAGWLYGGFQLVNNEAELIKEFSPSESGNCFAQVMASEWIPLQASWIDARAFFSVGGFASLASLEGGYEDIDLSRLIAHRFDFARCGPAVCSIRYGDRGSTTNYENFVRQNRRSREKCLDQPGAFQRLRASARATRDQAAYWQGRVAYFYLAALPWHLKQGRVMKTASRFCYALLALALSAPHFASADFWRGTTRQHHNLVRSTLDAMDKSFYTSTVWQR